MTTRSAVERHAAGLLGAHLVTLDPSDPRLHRLPGLTGGSEPRTAVLVLDAAATAAVDGAVTCYRPPEWLSLFVTFEDPRTADIVNLRAILKKLGVGVSTAQSLTEVALACGTVQGVVAGPSSQSADSVDPEPADPEPADPEPTDPEPTAETPADPTEAPSQVARGSALVGAIQTLTAATGQLEAVVLSATKELTAVHGRLLLADKGATSPEELSKTAKEKWRATAKSVTRAEIAAATGWGTGEVQQLVAMANTPVAVAAPVHHALTTGEAPWRLVRRFFWASRSLDTEDAAAVANGLFGSDPDTAVSERLDSEGEFSPGPWQHKEFHRAVDREVHKIISRDTETTRKARGQALANNDVRVMIDKDGTAAVTVRLTPTQAAGISDRIEKAARAARKAGDQRNLRQLRSAVAVALLMHGTLDMDDLPDDPALITVEQSDQLSKILHGLPAAELNVIVGLNTLIGTSPGSARVGECTCGAGGGAAAGAGADGPSARGSTGQPCPPGGAAPAGPDLPLEPDGEIGVGEVTGRHSLFLTPEEARVLALTPGSTMHRLVTDPISGALRERSSKAYRFDKSMRAHLIAADVFCRFPGCLRPASLAQIDHVQEHGTPGGHTCIGNAQTLDEPHHDLKTKKLWDAVLDANRDVTWTSLVGRIYRTKAHDYAQYTKLLTAATASIQAAIDEGTDPAWAVDDAVYQALSYRPPGGTLEAADDDAWAELFTGWDMVALTHTRSNGTRDWHPDPETSRHEKARHQETETVASAGQAGQARQARQAGQAGQAAQGDQQADHRDETAGNTEAGGQDRGATGEARGGASGDRSTPWSHDPDAPPPF